MGLAPTPDMLDFEAARRHGKLIQGPYHVALDITNRCNMRCKHCFNLSGSLDRAELTDDEVLALADELLLLKPYSFCFCGGEPLLRFDVLLEVTRRLVSNNITVSMVSNGWLMTKEKAEALREAGMAQVQISIDGPDAASHEALRGVPGSWEQACAAVRVLVKVGFPMRPISCCPSKYNADFIDEVIDMVIHLGGTQLRVQPLMLLGRAVEHEEELVPSREQYRKIAGRLLAAKGRVPIRIEWGDPIDHIIRFSTLLRDICPYVDIRSDGSLGVSAYLPLAVGNLRRHTLGEYWDAGLAQIWQTPLIQRLSTYIRSTEDFYQPDGYLPVLFFEDHLVVDLIDDDLFAMTPAEADRLVMDKTRRHSLEANRTDGGLTMGKAVLAKPKFMWDSVAYKREEKEGHLTIVSQNAPDLGSFVLNPTAQRVVELADGERSLSQVYAEFASTYDEVTPEAVKGDVNELLRQLGRLGLICWEGGRNPFLRVTPEVVIEDEASDLVAVLATESHLREIGDYLMTALGDPEPDDKLIIKSPVLFHLADYSDLVIRNKIFQFMEFFGLIRKGDETVGLCAVIASLPQSNSRIAHLMLLILDEEVDLGAGARLIHRALSRLNEYVATTNYKVRCYLAEEQRKSPVIMRLLTAIGFKEESLLKDEIGPGQDLLMMAYWIQEALQDSESASEGMN